MRFPGPNRNGTESVVRVIPTYGYGCGCAALSNRSTTEFCNCNLEVFYALTACVESKLNSNTSSLTS